MITDLLFKVKDIMNKDFIKVLPYDTINYAMNLMIEQFKDEVVVLDENEVLIGLFTRFDLAKIKKKGIDFNNSIEEYVNKDVITISPDFSVKNARDLMIKKNIGRLPVVENNKIIGILTSNNIRDTFYIKMNELLISKII